MEEDFRALLVGAGSVGLPAMQINWGVHPQGVPFPGIVLTVIDNADGLTLDGPDRLWQGRVQVDCYGRDYISAKALSRAVAAVLSGYHDNAFQGIFLIGTRDYHEAAATDRPFRVSQDFSTIWSA